MSRGLAFFFLTVAVAFSAAGSASAVVQEGVQKPNVVLILTDDMRKDDLKHMPQTEALIADEGVTYDNAFVTTPQCCPSRASTLRGQYVHNHGVQANSRNLGGGWTVFRDAGHEVSTVATWLDEVGYETALIGKYMNQYGAGGDRSAPPGWDEWQAMVGGEYSYYGFSLAENGAEVVYGYDEADYLTDVLASKARRFASRQADSGQPFFLYFSPYSPHRPYTPAPRHEGIFAGYQAPRPPSFDEADVSDKPGYVRRAPRLTLADEAAVDKAYRKRLEMLQSVDEAVGGLVGDLEAAGELENTYFVFTSDNGYLLGEHRISLTKYAPYEESIRVPLAIRGPGVPAGRSADEVALNIDLAPTVADLAGTLAPDFVDGRTLRPTFAADVPSGGWRTAFLEELFQGGGEVPRHRAIRTAGASPKKYVYYPLSRSEEFYELAADPHELKNADAVPRALKDRLAALKACAGEACRAAEDGR